MPRTPRKQEAAPTARRRKLPAVTITVEIVRSATPLSGARKAALNAAMTDLAARLLGPEKSEPPA